MRKILILAFSFLLVAASCGGDSPRGGPGISGSAQPSTGTDVDGGAGTDTPGTDGEGTVIELGPDDVVLTAGLVRFDDCDTLLDYLHAEYSARVGPWGFDQGGWFGPVGARLGMRDEAMTETAAAEPAAPSAAPVEGVDFSGTNVQEAGVDEADIVKTDGRRIFTLSSARTCECPAPRSAATPPAAPPSYAAPHAGPLPAVLKAGMGPSVCASRCGARGTPLCRTVACGVRASVCGETVDARIAQTRTPVRQP